MSTTEAVERVRQVLSVYANDEMALDIFWQLATAPTPAYTQTAIPDFIATNLTARYALDFVPYGLIGKATRECQQLYLQFVMSDVLSAITETLNGELGHLLREGVLRRLTVQTPVRRFLSAWLVARARWCHHFSSDPNASTLGTYDWAIGDTLPASFRDARNPLAYQLFATDGVEEADIEREAIAIGIVNRLCIKTTSGRLENRLRPGPRLKVTDIVY